VSEPAETARLLLVEMLAEIETDPYRHIGAWRSEISEVLRLLDAPEATDHQKRTR
jgi:hypothetical protein